MEVGLYRSARSDLVEAEWMLESGRPGDAARLAEQAALAFDELGIKYERARATVLWAAASFQLGDVSKAGQLLRETRKLSAREENRFWRAVLDVYRALVHEREQQPQKARACAERALRTLGHSPLTGKIALCHLLLARLALQAGQLDGAEKELREAEPLVNSAALRFHFHYLRGLLREQQGETAGALEEIGRAAEIREDARRVRVEELKIPFLGDETEVYEAAVRLSLARPEEALRWVWRAKASPANTPRAIARLRGELRSLCKEMEAEETGERAPKAEALRELRLRIQEGEEGLLQHEAPAVAPIEWPEEGAVLIEYFVVGDRIHSWAVTRNSVRHAECGGLAELKRTLRLWQLGRESEVHLRELQRALVEPWRELDGKRAVIKASGFLREAPFGDLMAGLVVEEEAVTSGVRQETCRQGDYEIELRWDEDWVAGQIARARAEMGGVRVRAMAHKRVLGETVCSELGEFVMEVRVRDRMRLRFEVEGEEVEVYLK